MSKIFVFGSNTKGYHGKGAALAAKQHHGAESGVGNGRTGNAYAIPTKGRTLFPLPLDLIQSYVAEFIDYANAHPELQFEVTRIGCGYAGYTDGQIAPFFKGAPSNCNLPLGWRAIAEAANDSST